MRWWLVLLSFLLACSACPTFASANDRPTCTKDNSMLVRAQSLLSDPGSYVNRCVRVRGLLAYRRIYPGTLSMYATTDDRPDLSGPDSNSPATSIAAYPSDTVPIEVLSQTRSFAELIGWIGRCELYFDPSAFGPNTITLIEPLCEFERGPTIEVDSVNPIPNVTTRLSGQIARLKYGNLALAQESEIPQPARDGIQHWFAAVQARDLNTINSTYMNPSYSPRDRKEFVNPDTSPFRSIFGRSGPVQITYLQRKAGRNEDAQYYGCVCKISSCTYEWPIVAIDATYLDKWPYMCVSADRSGTITLDEW